MEQLLPCPQRLVADPAASYEQAGMVVDEHEKARPHGTRRSRMGHEGTDEHVADPALVGYVGLIASERPAIAEKLGSREAAPAELLGERALGDPDAVAGRDDLADVGGAPSRHFQTQADRGIEQGRVHPGAPVIAPGPVAQASETFGPIPADPAIERVAADVANLATGVGVLAGDPADHLAALSASELGVERLRDQVVSPEGESFGGVRCGHWSSPAVLGGVPAITEETAIPAKGEPVLGASRVPPVMRAAMRHGETGPRRRLQATASAATAAAARGRGAVGRSKPDQPAATAAASRTRASSPATCPKRRHHSRTVVSGRPVAAAILRTPIPLTESSSAAPITSTLSYRYGRTNQGSRASVRPHDRQRTRGTKMTSSSPARRWRRYPDQGLVWPPQAGQRTAGGATSRPLAAYVLTSDGVGNRITDGGPSFHHRPLEGLHPLGGHLVLWVRIIVQRDTRCRRPHSARPSPAG